MMITSLLGLAAMRCTRANERLSPAPGIEHREDWAIPGLLASQDSLELWFAIPFLDRDVHAVLSEFAKRYRLSRLG